MRGISRLCQLVSRLCPADTNANLQVGNEIIPLEAITIIKATNFIGVDRLTYAVSCLCQLVSRLCQQTQREPNGHEYKGNEINPPTRSK